MESLQLCHILSLRSKVTGPMHTSICWWECKIAEPLWKAVRQGLKKLSRELPPDPAVPFLGLYSSTEAAITKCQRLVAYTTIIFLGEGRLGMEARNPRREFPANLLSGKKLFRLADSSLLVSPHMPFLGVFGDWG